MDGWMWLEAKESFQSCLHTRGAGTYEVLFRAENFSEL